MKGKGQEQTSVSTGVKCMPGGDCIMARESPCDTAAQPNPEAGMIEKLSSEAVCVLTQSK